MPNPGPNERLSELAERATEAIDKRTPPGGRTFPVSREYARLALTAAGVPELLRENERLREALQYARNELDRWGFGDFHWGEMPRDPRILTALEIADAALEALPTEPPMKGDA